jgi:hypothetical protein
MWPTLDRYNSAIHQPDRCFADRDLRASWPQRDRRGLPVPMTGAFGGVYRLDSSERAWAVKCFTRDSDEWRYSEICTDLRARPTGYLAAIEYLTPRGILVDERWYPVLKMEWVAGLTLDAWLEQQHTNPPALEALAAGWVDALAALAERGIAHGDLQHGNILVAGSPEHPRLRLVDYDAMYVPALAGEPATETGLPDYQHPRRSQADFNPRLDNFAALVIYISLRALAYQPDLWPRYHREENLIFRRTDFVQSAQSSLIAELRALPDDRLVRLVETLVVACAGGDPTGLPPLPTLVTGRVSAQETGRPAAPVPDAPTRALATGSSGAPPNGHAPTGDDLPVLCPYCRERNRTIARFCRGCGRDLPRSRPAQNGIHRKPAGAPPPGGPGGA